MKKLTVLCFSLLIFILSLLAFLNFSFDAEERIENGKQTIVIDKPEGISNDEYLESIQNVMDENGLDIMFKYVDVTQNKPEIKYYKTNNSADFIDIKCEKKVLDPESDECISTTKHNGYTNYKLNAANTNSEISFFNLKAASEYNLNSVVYYIDNELTDEVLDAVTGLGYSAEIKKSMLISGKYSILLFGSIPLILFMVSMGFYGLSNGKKHVLKKMDGYMTGHILNDEIKKTLPLYFIVLIIIILAATSIGVLRYKLAYAEYIRSLMSYMIIGLSAALNGYIILSAIITSHSNAEQIKGKAPKKSIYVMSQLLKFCFVLFLMFFMSIAIRNIVLAYNTFNTAKILSVKTEGYVTVPVYDLNQSVEGLEKNYLELYNKTVNDYNGILIHTRNYELDIDGTTMCEEFGQNEIKINENYLEFNPIYDMNGEKIIGESLEHGDFLSILVPSSKTEEIDNIREKLEYCYGTDISVKIYDDKKSKIYSYNSKALKTVDGSIESPVIMVANNEILLNDVYIYSYITGGYYFFKPKTDTPYEEFSDLMENLGIDQTTNRLDYISENYRTAVFEWLNMLKIYATQSILLTFGFISTVIFTSKLYCENYKNKISTYLIEGASLLYCMRNHLLITSLAFLICFSVMKSGFNVGISWNYNILLVMFIGELIAGLFTSRKYTKTNLNEVIKGAD